MPERRKETRTSIDRTIDVLDEDYREKLGTLEDISPSGLRIRGKEPVEVYDELRVLITLPGPILGKKSISVTAVCVWSKPDSEPEYWLSGFEFAHVSQAAASLVLGLILEIQKNV